MRGMPSFFVRIGASLNCLLVVLMLGAGIARAEDKPVVEQDAPKTREEALRRAGVKLQDGPATVTLGKTAELKLPAGYHFVPKESLDRFYELTQNVRTGSEVGVVLTPGWLLFFDYDEIGYVKYEDKDKLD